MAALDVFKLCRESLYNNVLALGLDLKDFQKKCNIPFTSDFMLLPHNVSFLYVTHFLFTKLDSKKSADCFKSLWPILTPKDQAAFRKTAFNWLTNLCKENEDAKIPTVVMTMFVSPSGVRVCHVFLAFSRFVLTVVSRRKYRNDSHIPQYPILSNNKNINKIISTLHRAQLNDKLTELNSLKLIAKEREDTFQDSANTLSSLHYKLKEEVTTLKKSLEETGKEICTRMNISDKSDAKEKMETSVDTLVKSVRKSWRPIHSLHQEATVAQKTLNFVLNCAIPACLDGKHFPITVAPDLLQAIQMDLQKANVIKIQENGKLNVMNLLKLFVITLPTLSDPLKSLSTHLDLSALNLKLSSLQSQLVSLSNMNNRIEYQITGTISKDSVADEVLHSVFSEVPQPVIIDGKQYDLQRSTPETELLSTKCLNDSYSENILNISPINWLESPQSDNISSPDLRRRVLVRNMSVSPTKPVRTSKDEKIPPRGAVSIPQSAKPSAKTDVSLPKPIQSVRPKVQQLKSPKKRMADKNLKTNYLKRDTTKKLLQENRSVARHTLKNNIPKCQETTSNGVKLAFRRETSPVVLETRALKPFSNTPSNKTAEFSSNFEHDCDIVEENLVKENICKVLSSSPSFGVEEDNQEHQSSVATTHETGRTLLDTKESISSALPGDFELNYDLFSSPVMSASSMQSLAMLDTSKTSCTSNNMSFNEILILKDCCNISSDLDGSVFLDDNF